MAESPKPTTLTNPFRPGAGQQPTYLAGRTKEQDVFRDMLKQDPVSQNAIVTGLRGVGKTVLLEAFRPIAHQEKWLWTGNDLSESTSVTEERVARRLVVDLSLVLGPVIEVGKQSSTTGFVSRPIAATRALAFEDLWSIYEQTPGLVLDKLKAVFVQVAELLAQVPIRGVVFAYDEAQNLADHAKEKEYPLSLLLDLFSYLQRVQLKRSFMLVLTGLPTLFPKLNEARTYTERMFHVLQLSQLSYEDARKAVVQPLVITKSSLLFSDQTVKDIVKYSGGYPYFIQFIGKEVFDAWIGKITKGEVPSVPLNQILEKLDQDFFSPRWTRATDRQQQFMKVIAQLPNADDEFSVAEIARASKAQLKTGFTPSHATQMLQTLAERGLIYKNRRGAYSFAVPLLAQFIQRQEWDPESQKPLL